MLVIVDEIVKKANLVEVAGARFTGKEMQSDDDPLFEGKLAIDRFAEGWGDRLTVRQPPREKEYELPFELPDDRRIHCLSRSCGQCVLDPRTSSIRKRAGEEVHLFGFVHDLDRLADKL